MWSWEVLVEMSKCVIVRNRFLWSHIFLLDICGYWTLRTWGPPIWIHPGSEGPGSANINWNKLKLGVPHSKIQVDLGAK